MKVGQAKKSVYDMYPTMISSLEKKLSKAFGPKANPRHELGKILESDADLSSTLEVSIYVEENYWQINGRQVIFPEYGDVIDNLLKARYEVYNTEGFALPYPSFVVAVPSGYKSAGVRMPSFLASYARQDIPEEKIFPFLDSINGNRDLVEYNNGDKSPYVLVVQYRNPIDGAHGKVSVEERDLPRILRCRTAQEYSAEMNEYDGILAGAVKSNPEDVEIQFFALKLAAAMGVYCLATGGKRLLDGFPGSVMPRLMNHDGSSGMRLSTLHNASTASKGSPETHYRTWHFRQLRAERYYQREHAHLAPGSRYVFVSDAVIGQPVDPSTLL